MRGNRLTAAAALWLVSHATSAATIVVDTGHSPQKAGSVSPSGYKEYDYNRQISTLVILVLARRGHHAVDVHHLGLDQSLTQRTSPTAHAHLFVSIHHDSIQQAWIDAGRSRDYKGFAVFVSNKNPRAELSRACGLSIGASLARTGERPSLFHAMPTKGENRPLLDRATGLHQFDDLVVLKSAKSAAVLIEVGVIANPDEEERLAEPAMAQRAADAIAAGILACLP